ncbi:hypothetical protein DMENIID0001_160180 [Sergentomyia squamirostris]
MAMYKVTGVVGRAETLSSVFFLAAFLSYAKATEQKKSTELANNATELRMSYSLSCRKNACETMDHAGAQVSFKDMLCMCVLSTSLIL